MYIFLKVSSPLQWEERVQQGGEGEGLAPACIYNNECCLTRSKHRDGLKRNRMKKEIIEPTRKGEKRRERRLRRMEESAEGEGRGRRRSLGKIVVDLAVGLGAFEVLAFDEGLDALLDDQGVGHEARRQL